MKENTFYNVLNKPFIKIALATTLLVSTGASTSIPMLTGNTQQAEAAKTETYTTTESTNQTQSQTFTVTDITKLNSVISDTGKVEVISINGDQVTVRMTDGEKIRTDQTGGTIIPAETKYLSGQSTSSYNSDGYSGILSSYVESGNYTPADTKVVTETSTMSSNNFSGTVPYAKDGYTGNLTKTGISTSYVFSGSLYEDILSGSDFYALSKTYQYKGVKSSNVTFYTVANGNTYYKLTFDVMRVDNGEKVIANYESIFPSNKDISYLEKNIKFKTANYPDRVEVRFYTEEDDRVWHYNQNYTGSVTKPAVDTRVYKYQGNVTKPSSDTRTYADIYQYNLTFDYETDSIPPTISLTPNLTTPTNKNVDVQVNATDLGGLKQVKWAKGNQTDTYFSTQGNEVFNNTFTTSENDTYTVYAEDLSGNKTIETILIDNIDKTAPSLAIITASNENLTNLDIMINISFPADAKSKEYRLDNGKWMPYASSLLMNTNGKVEARSTDAAGNTSETTIYEVNNIDKINPTIETVSIKENYLNISTNDIGSTVKKIEAKLNNGAYQDYQEKQIKIMQNAEVTVRVTDEAGNVTEKHFTLTSDAYYQDLLDQIQAIQKQIDMGGQDSSGLKALLDILETIKKEANGLTLPSEQATIEKKSTDLAKQIQSVLETIDKAKVELEDIGENPTQMELDQAKEKIEALPPSPEKDKLLKDLEDKQNQKDLKDVKDLVENLDENSTQAEIDHVRDLVKDLIDSDRKNDLLNIIKDHQSDYDKLIEKATKAVDELNDRSTPEELQNAKDLVNKLPNGPEKDALLDKQKEKEKAIKDRLVLDALLAKAEAAVKHSEAFPTNFNIELAEKAANLLPEVPEKYLLLERIQAIKDNILLEEAEKKVVQVERYERDPYLADAIKLVDSLKESDGKKALKDRLQTILDKAKAIKDAEEAASGNDGIFDPTNPDRSIVDAINTIQDPVAKSYLLKWHKANDSASKYFSRAMTTNASKVMEGLPESYLAKVSYANLIAELTTRTENLAKAWEEASRNKATEQLFSKTYTLVDLYESSKSDRNYKNAIAAVAALPDGVAKTAIETQLASLKNHIEEDNDSTPSLNSKESIEITEKAVTNYEKYKSSYYQKKAKEAVELLVDSEEKATFQVRLDALMQ